MKMIIMINEKRYAIENAILILIATQQPIARDLRQLAAMLEVITEIERMGDYAKGIAKVTIKLEGCGYIDPSSTTWDIWLNWLSVCCTGLFQRSSQKTRRQASSIPLEDDEVDEFYNKIYHNLVSLHDRKS
jgi:phosphate transport system protein